MLALDLTDPLHPLGSQLDAYGWRVLGQRGSSDFDYQEFIRWGEQSPDLRVLNRDGADWTLEWPIPDAPQSLITATIRDSGTRGPELLSISLSVYAGSATQPGAKLMHVKRIELTRHIVDGRMLRSARTSDQLASAGEEWPATWAVVTATPISCRRVPLSRSMVHLHRLPTDVLQDARFDLAHPPGETRVNLDGLLLTTAATPHGDVGWDLDRWIRDLPAHSDSPLVLPAKVTARGSDGRQFYDAGDVEIGRSEPARVSHDFMLQNDAGSMKVVKQIIKSCGCLKCEIDKHEIAPGQSATLTVAMMVTAPGERRQEVAVVFEDETVERFEIQARGYSPGELRILCSGFDKAPDGWKAEIRAYWKEADPALLVDEPPTLSMRGPDGSVLSFEGWTVIEPPSNDRLRPRRLFGRGTVTLGHFTGDGETDSLEFMVLPSRRFSVPILRFDE